MIASTVWISFDLGIRGDYEGLYAWLNSYGAKECGDSLAVLKYRPPLPAGSLENVDLIDILKKEIREAFKPDKQTRIYVVYRDQRTRKNKGKFIFGSRRPPKWAGYGNSGEDDVDMED